MGSIWIPDLADVLRASGLDVVECAGWQTRSRGSGGYDAIMGIGVHHDAGAAGTPIADRLNWEMHADPDAPVGACHLHTDGTWYVMAAGATNTQGKGGPYTTSRGTIPVDAGNRYLLSVEASNNGVGELWPTIMQQSYVTGCAALCARFDLDPSRDIVAHFEWSPGRKIDPAGPSRYATGTASWNMDLFRHDVANYTPEDDDDMTDDQLKQLTDRLDKIQTDVHLIQVRSNTLVNSQVGIIAADVDRIADTVAGKD